MEENPDYFRLESFLDVIYSAVVGFLLYEFVTKYNNLNQLHRYIVIFLFMYIFDDYVTMKLTNSLKSYQGTTRWAIDVIMVFFHATTVYFFISLNGIFLLYFSWTYFLSIVWAFFLKAEKNIGKNCKEYLTFSMEYYCFSSSAYTLSLLIMGILSLLSKSSDETAFFNQAVVSFIIVTVLSQSLLIYLKYKMIRKKYFSLDIANSMVRQTGPFLSKWIIFLILFLRMNRKSKRKIAKRFLEWNLNDD